MSHWTFCFCSQLFQIFFACIIIPFLTGLMSQRSSGSTAPAPLDTTRDSGNIRSTGSQVRPPKSMSTRFAAQDWQKSQANAMLRVCGCPRRLRDGKISTKQLRDGKHSLCEQDWQKSQANAMLQVFLAEAVMDSSTFTRIAHPISQI